MSNYFICSITLPFSPLCDCGFLCIENMITLFMFVRFPNERLHAFPELHRREGACMPPDRLVIERHRFKAAERLLHCCTCLFCKEETRRSVDHGVARSPLAEGDDGRTTGLRLEWHDARVFMCGEENRFRFAVVRGELCV